MHIKPNPAPRAPVTIRNSAPRPDERAEIQDRVSLTTSSFEPSTGSTGLWKGLALAGVFAAGALVGGIATTSLSPHPTQTHCPEQDTVKGLAGEGEWTNPDDWKEEIGGSSRVETRRQKEPSSRSTPSPKETRQAPRQRGLAGEGEWSHPDDWKENLGGGSSYRDDQPQNNTDSDGYHDGRGLSGEGDWGGPDDWKSRF